MINSEELIQLTLEKNYDVVEDVAKRYSRVILQRAARFYLQGKLDSGVVEEDLYRDEDSGEYVNLNYSEKKEQEFIEEEEAVLNSL